MHRFRRLCRRPFPVFAFAILWLYAASAGAEDQPKTAPPAQPAAQPTPPPVKPSEQPAAPAKPSEQPAPPAKPSEQSTAPAKPSEQPAAPAKSATQPKPTITAKKEAEGVLGQQVYGVDGADMGMVTNVLVDRAGNPVAVVIDFGGFLGVGTRKIAIDWHLLQFHPGDKKKPITLSLQKDQLKAAPTYNPDKPRIVGAPAPEPHKPQAKPVPEQKPEAAPKPETKPEPGTKPESEEKPTAAPTPATPSTNPTTAPAAPKSQDNTGK